MVIYLVAGLACLCIMVIIDFILGAEAEHLNAWSIINQWVGNTDGIHSSLAVRKFGLIGASFLMLLFNAVLGIGLIQLIKGVIWLVHSGYNDQTL